MNLLVTGCICPSCMFQALNHFKSCKEEIKYQKRYDKRFCIIFIKNNIDQNYCQIEKKFTKRQQHKIISKGSWFF